MNENNPNMREKLPPLDFNTLELLQRKTVIYAGSDAGYRNLDTLMDYEKDFLIIAEHLQGEAFMLSDDKESPEINKTIDWLLAASDVYSNEAKKVHEEHVYSIDDDEPKPGLIKPHNGRKWWNIIVGGGLALALGATALYSIMKDPTPEPVPQPIIEITEEIVEPPEKSTGFSVAFPFQLQDIESIRQQMNVPYVTIPPPEKPPMEIAELPFLHPEREVYVVQRGDNLNRIAGLFIPDEYNTANNRHLYALHLASTNEISNPNFITPGQPIIIADFDTDSLRAYIPSLEDKIGLPIESEIVDEERVEQLRADGPSTELIAIKHDNPVCDAIFNYGEIEPGTIRGVEERVVTDMLGVPGAGEIINEYWEKNCSVQGTHYGTPEQSTTNPLIVPIETRENADRIRYGNSLEEMIESDDINDLLIRDEDIQMNTPDNNSYSKPGSLFIGSEMQLDYVMSKNPHSEYNENLSAHNLAQMIKRGENISRAYEMNQQEKSRAEIAEALNVTEGTVQRYLKEGEKLAKNNNDTSNPEATKPLSQEYKAA